MGWYCVRIEHQRLGPPLDETFRNMLWAEFQYAGQPADCRVYGRETEPGAHIYYFSPKAYLAIKAFVDFWQGYECHEPQEKTALDLIL